MKKLIFGLLVGILASTSFGGAEYSIDKQYFIKESYDHSSDATIYAVGNRKDENEAWGFDNKGNFLLLFLIGEIF